MLSCTVKPYADYFVSVGGGFSVGGGRSVHRAMVGEEMLMLNGWPTRDPRLESIVAPKSNAFLRGLAGNAFSSTVVIAVVSSLLVAADSQKNRASTSSADAHDLMQNFKRFRAA